MLQVSDVERLVERVWPVAEKLGVNPPHIHWELVSPHMIQVLASQSGMPIRYNHWSFGKAYQHMKTAHDFRLTEIYELVINSQPTYAFIDRTASAEQALMIIAHVVGHADFFQHNRLYQDIPKDMVVRMARHRREIESWGARHGKAETETLIDAGHVLMDYSGESTRRYPMGVARDDVLGYVARHAPRLESWERDLLSALWEESRYFWPQQLTKISNEGYATFWHVHLLRELSLSPSEMWEVARLNSQIVQVHPPQLNPYRLGYLLYDEAYRRGGMELVFRLRDLYDDEGLVRAEFDESMAERAGLALYHEREDDPAPRYVEGGPIQRGLVRDLDRAGLPHISVDESLTTPEHLNLRHHHEGRDLDFAELPFALKQIAERVWHGPVTLRTIRQRVARKVTHDGHDWMDQVG